MFSHALSLSAAISNGVLDMTTDFAPLFIGLVVGLGLSVLGMVASIAAYDIRQARQQTRQETDTLAPLPKAA
jgi:hypothetical protein